MEIFTLQFFFYKNAWEQIKEDFLRVNKIHNTATLLPPKGLSILAEGFMEIFTLHSVFLRYV